MRNKLASHLSEYLSNSTSPPASKGKMSCFLFVNLIDSVCVQLRLIFNTILSAIYSQHATGSAHEPLSVSANPQECPSPSDSSCAPKISEPSSDPLSAIRSDKQIFRYSIAVAVMCQQPSNNVQVLVLSSLKHASLPLSWALQSWC